MYFIMILQLELHDFPHLPSPKRSSSQARQDEDKADDDSFSTEFTYIFTT